MISVKFTRKIKCMNPSLRRFHLLIFLAAFLTSTAGEVTQSWAYSPQKRSRTAQVSHGAHTPLGQADLTEIGYRLQQAASTVNPALKAVSPYSVVLKNGGLPFHRNENNGTPIFMGSTVISRLSRGTGKISTGVSRTEIALELIAANRDIFKLENPRDELKGSSETESGDGKYHIRFEQWYQSIPVWGHEIIVHFDASGALYAVNGRYSPTPTGLDITNIRVNELQAIEKAVANLSKEVAIQELSDFLKKIYSYNGPAAKLYIFVDAESHEPCLVWHVLIRPDAKDRWYYFIDAQNGTIVEKYNATPYQTPVTATAINALGEILTINVAEYQGRYYMADMEAAIYTYDAHHKVVDENNYPSLVSSIDNTWTDSIAVSAHSNTREVFDYYLENHNRPGIDGNGIELPLIINFTLEGTPFYNAFWSGGFIAFGNAAPFAAALDIVAHEFTHGVVEYTVGLEYKFQSGALNEAFCDALAAVVDPDWEIGEDLPGGAFRDIANPERFGLPAHMDDYRVMPLDQDQGGVHINMSIPTRAYFLTASEIGREKTAAIWYGILDNMYLTPKAQFIDMRLASIQSATDLFGADSNEVTAVKNAFDQVGILEEVPTQPPEDIPPAEGEQWIAFVSDYETGNTLTLAKPVIESQQEIIIPTTARVFTGGSSPITVSRDGTLLIFVDENNNLRLIELVTFEEFLIEDTGDWSSIALSPDGKFLAATSIYTDRVIYVFDIETPENSKAIPLYTASTEGVDCNTAVFADALDWDQSSAFILYDAYHELPVEGGNPIEFWDVNLLDVESNVITRIKTPTEFGIQVGNPSFAETNDRFIVCDLFSSEIDLNVMVAIDIYNLEISVLRDNGMISEGYPNLGRPRYSPDDTYIIFQLYDRELETATLYQLPLAEDKISPAGEERAYWYGGFLPVWFVRGELPTEVEVKNFIPASFTLSQNFPNPFNPVTTIPFTMDEPGIVTLKVYDILGQEIETPVDGYRPAGNHTVRFDGSNRASGLYFYRLQISDWCETGRMMLAK